MLVVYIVLNDTREGWFAGRSAALAPPVYRPRVEAMKSASARARTMAGLWLLEHGLAALGTDRARLAGLGFAAGGRPMLAGGPYFSISHSAALVACALSAEAAIGLDVEQRRNDVSSRLQHMIAADGDFFDAWCAREATVKASGHVGLARIRATQLAGDIARLDASDWHLIRLSLAPGYAACVAGTQATAEGAVRLIDCSEQLMRARAE